MRKALTVAVLATTLVACSYTPTEQQTAFGTRPADPGAIEGEARRDARGAINVLGTPFYAVFKATACVASVVVAAPAAGLIALTDRKDKAELRRRLDRGVGQNCRGSYVLRG